MVEVTVGIKTRLTTISTRYIVQGTMVFATASLAKRIEAAEASLIEQIGQAASRRLPDGEAVCIRIGGGVATFAGHGAPSNKVAGLGFAEPPDTTSLDHLEREFDKRDAPVQVEFASLGDPSVPRLLTERGYRLVGFENVLGLALDDASLAQLGSGGDAATRIDRAGPDEVPAWRDTVITGFLTPDIFDGPPSHESFEREAIERAYGDMMSVVGFRLYLARRDGEIAAGGALRLWDGVAQLSGAATLPQHRRKGVQSALFRERLKDAAAQGCDVAVVTTQPGSKSQENAQRFDFGVLYVRAVLVREAGISKSSRGDQQG
jgi:ribosomal protein S18 acetylase RimI-like enzyme